jgi:hypothetical protein
MAQRGTNSIFLVEICRTQKLHYFMRNVMHYFEIYAMADWGFLRFKTVPTVRKDNISCQK